MVGRARAEAYREEVTIARIASLGEDTAARRDAALAALAVLVDLYDRGMREPLPLACGASAAYAQVAAAGGDAEAAAKREWETVFGFDKEDREPEHLVVFGRAVTAAELIAAAPRLGEVGEGWDLAEATRFGRYARRLWSALLAREVVTDR